MTYWSWVSLTMLKMIFDFRTSPPPIPSLLGCNSTPVLSSSHMHEIAGLRSSQVEASPRAAADTPALVSGVSNLRRQEQSVAYLKQMLFARLVVWVCAWKSVCKHLAETGCESSR